MELVRLQAMVRRHKKIFLSPSAPCDIRVEATREARAAEFVLFTGYELTKKLRRGVSCVLFFLPAKSFFSSRQAQLGARLCARGFFFPP